jgi:hypothetical protein
MEALGIKAGNLVGQYLQLVRSTPLLVGTVIGHKRKEHVLQNIALVKDPILEGSEYMKLLEYLDGPLST